MEECEDRVESFGQQVESGGEHFLRDRRERVQQMPNAATDV
jgi:hypothetical protein